MTTLFVLPFVPSKNAPQAGHRLAFDFICDAIKNGDTVEVFLILSSIQVVPEYLVKLTNGNVYVEVVNKFNAISSWIFFGLSIYPRFMTRYNKRVLGRLISIIHKKNYKCLRFEFSQTFVYGYFIKKIKGNSNTSILYSVHDLQIQVVLRGGGFESWFFKWVRGSERKLLRTANCIKTLSEKDKILIHCILDLGVDVVVSPPTLGDFVYYVRDHRDGSREIKNSLIFWGAMGRRENEEAVVEFFERVFARLQKNGYMYQLYIVGSNPSERIKSLKSEFVEVTGFVEDPSDWFFRASIGIVPLEKGAGVKLKTLELIESGISHILSTPVGAEGVLADDRRLIVRDFDKFYDELVNLYT